MIYIIAVNLSDVDLNLFLVLHTVLEERSATAAGKRLHVSQSAVSNALARLRDLFGDPLFVREGRGLVPTPRAEQLAPIVANVVAQLTRAVEAEPVFDPGTTTRAFTLCVADSHQICDVPGITARLARTMPRARLRVVSPDFLVATDGLATGVVDAAVFPEGAARGLRSQPLVVERAALVVRRGHPVVNGAINRRQFNTLPHVDVQLALGKPGSGHELAERYWRSLGLRRDVAITVPSFVAAAMIVARTDYIAGLPDRVARVFAGQLPITIARPSFPMPATTIVLVWHDRTHADRGARAFRELVVAAVGGG